MSNRPSDSALCGQKNCNHKFGIHWQTYDGVYVGCSYKSSDQRDGNYVCPCEGFATVYRYKEPTRLEPPAF